ncbi:MAG: thiamine phosphate synthase [Candidatus Tumulicola sp.]
MASAETAPLTRAGRAALLHGIYLIVNDGAADPLPVTGAALRAGVRIVQYRAKCGIVEGRLRDLRALTRARRALLIVNDDARAALKFDCDGVHLGRGDAGFTDVARVRAMVGDRLIGLSCGTAAEASAAASQDADYLGVGPVYATASKDDAGDPIGIDGLLGVAGAGRLPVAAIGGIGALNVGEVARSGVAMAAVISAIGHDPDPAAAALRLVRVWNGNSRP